MGLITLVTLNLELLFTRVISVMAYYHLSFFIISLAVLGMTAGALLTYVWPRYFEPRAALPAFADWFFLSIPLSIGCAFAITQTESGNLTGALALALTAILISVPFVLSGILVSLTLTRCGLPYGRIYAVDLLGAALGSLLFVPVLDQLSPGGFALLLSALAALASWAYRRSFAVGGRRLPLAWAPLMVLAVCLTESSHIGLVPLSAKGQRIDPDSLLYQGWNSHSFVMVEQMHKQLPSMWGASPRMEWRPVDQAELTIDGSAGTAFVRFDGDLGPLAWLNYDVTAVPYQLHKPGAVAVIGAGGGRDILSALVNGADSVVGIEVNKRIVDLHRGAAAPELSQFNQVSRHPAVTLVHDEARSYMTRSPQCFDVIQMSLVDTWAASAAGAYSLTENGLYTREAWHTFLDRLTDQGLFSVSRWHSENGLGETTRCVALAVAVCQERGLTPRDHIALVSSNKVANLIISRQPIQGGLLERLQEVCQKYQYQLLLAPGLPSSQPLYQQLVDCQSEPELAAVCSRQILDISPPSDDRPYFFNQLRFWRLDSVLFDQGGFECAAGNLRATGTVLLLLAFGIAAVLGGVLWPLRRVGLPAGMPLPFFRTGLLYFAAIGVGFMLIEMAFVQRFSLVLGHPSYSLACVIGSMVLAAGVGSAISEYLPADQPRLFLVYPAIILAVQLAAWGLLPAATLWAVTQPLATRVAVTLAFTIPCGLVMGLGFPLGMVQITRYGASVAPWMWGINGAASVVGTIVAILISMSLGISATVLAGTVCYGLILAANLRFQRLGQASAATVPAEPVSLSVAPQWQKKGMSQA
ncbi:MAG: hypothetical protein L0211_02845 [Planctomycetaceae bacterium]|nr:hypothetical protein [Planctomycetaceae bacterium]